MRSSFLFVCIVATLASWQSAVCDSTKSHVVRSSGATKDFCHQVFELSGQATHIPDHPSGSSEESPAIHIAMPKPHSEVVRGLEERYGKPLVKVAAGGEGVVYRVGDTDTVYKVPHDSSSGSNPSVRMSHAAEVYNKLAKNDPDHLFLAQQYDRNTGALRMEYFPGLSLGSLMSGKYSGVAVEGTVINARAEPDPQRSQLHQLRVSRDVMGKELWKHTYGSGSDTWKNQVRDQLLEAVRIAHNSGIVLRDLKPDNVLIGLKKDTKGNVIGFQIKIIDLGLSAEVSDFPPGLINLPSGTPSRMSKNQWKGRDAKYTDDLEKALPFLLRELYEGKSLDEGGQSDYLRNKFGYEFPEYRSSPRADRLKIGQARATALWHRAKNVEEYIEVQKLGDKYKDDPKKFFDNYSLYLEKMPLEALAKTLLENEQLRKQYATGLGGLSAKKRKMLHRYVTLLKNGPTLKNLKYVAKNPALAVDDFLNAHKAYEQNQR